MTIIRQGLLLLMAVVASAQVLASTGSESPVGYWKTIDDVTGNPKAIIHITQRLDTTLRGKIIKLFATDHVDEICSACTDERRNQPILGMRVLDYMKQSDSNSHEWSGGEILDPKTGKMYHCKLLLADDGQKMRVRGYIGLPLFGRSQTWLRVANPNA